MNTATKVNVIEPIMIACIEKGISIEIELPCSFYRYDDIANKNKMYTARTVDSVRFAINGGKGVYHWYEVLGDSIFFDHSYSANTGATTKDYVGKREKLNKFLAKLGIQA